MVKKWKGLDSSYDLTPDRLSWLLRYIFFSQRTFNLNKIQNTGAKDFPFATFRIPGFPVHKALMQKAGRKDPFGALRWGQKFCEDLIRRCWFLRNPLRPTSFVKNHLGWCVPKPIGSIMVDFNYRIPSTGGFIGFLPSTRVLDPLGW